MGLIDSLIKGLRSKIVGWLEGEYDHSYTDRANSMVSRRDYRLGEQRRFLRRSREGFDDNIVGNFLGLALDRSISLLFGKEVEFDFGEDAPQEAVDFIDGIWEDNNKPILLHKLAMYGGEDGTVFAKLIPDTSKHHGWRISAQDPIFKDILTEPNDDEKVIQYSTQYKYIDLDGKEIAQREVMTAGNYTAQTVTDASGNVTIEVMQGDPNATVPNWLIQNFILSSATGGKWALEDQRIWPYELPPIIHWQNLPMVGNTWGMPDLPDDVVEMQDKSNLNLSNINRIVRLFAHPFRWSRGFGGARVGAGATAEMDAGPDKMPNVDSPTAEITQLPPVGDVPGATSHAQNLRQIIFDVTRNMDISSMKDKVGGLTNFGLRILYFDALNKLDTKRSLYGWGLREINRRLFLFSNMEPVDCEIIWQDPLPQDQAALRQNYEIDLRMGIADKQTIAERLGYDWETVKARLEEQREAEDQARANIGAIALENFERFGLGAGGGAISNANQRRERLAR